MTYKLTCPCHFGIESVLSFEVKKIGGENVTVTDGKVTFTGDEAVIARANMCLSTAERVGIVLAEFKATTFEELFQGVKAIPLENYVGKLDKFPNKGYSLNSKLSSVPACQKIIKKACVERLKAKYGIGYFQETGNLYQLQFSIMKDNVTIVLDTSGEGLHKRGYRRQSTLAPIKETLAAGIIDIARVRDKDFICDPFCGSGTMIIESAIKALNIPPCINRTFTAMDWDIIPRNVWIDELERGKAGIKKDVEFRGTGYDIDKSAVFLSAENARKAGVSDYVKFEQRDINDFTYFDDKKVKIICNPPYGERLLEVDEAEELCRVMGKRMLPLDGNNLYVITPNEKFEELFGKKCDKNRKLYNGMIMCRLYTYFK